MAIVSHRLSLEAHYLEHGQVVYFRRIFTIIVTVYAQSFHEITAVAVR